MNALLTSDIEGSTKLMLDAVNNLDDDLSRAPEIDTNRGLACLAALEEVNRTLAIVRGVLVNILAAQMTEKRVTVENVGTFERRRKTDRTKWDKDELAHRVLDTRLESQATPGEYLEETQLQKILHVFPLGAPRLTALRARKIDPDEWCTSEPAGWAIQVIS